MNIQPTFEAPAPVVSLGQHRYKASLQSIAPMMDRSALEQFDRGLLAVSLGSANFEGARLEAIIGWLDEQFEECTVAIADSIYRLTLQVTQNLPPATARDAAIAAGWNFYEQNRGLFAQARRCRFDFVRFSEIESRRRTDFETHFATFQAIFDRDRAFRQTVESFGQLYLGRQAEGDGGLSREEAWVRQQMATLYLLEELAIFAILQEIGPFVYPGSIKSIQDLAGGRFPEAPLQELVFIALRLNRGGAYFADRAVRQLKPRSALINGGGGLDPQALESWPILEGYLRPVKFRAGQDIITYDQADTGLYILTEGQAEVILPNPDRSIKQVIDWLEAGAVCGEQAFLDGEPRSAGVRAVTDGQAYLLERPAFDRLQAEHPQVAVTVLRDLVGRTLTGRQRAHSWESQQRIGG